MKKVTVFSTQFCGYCVRAKQLLQQRGIPFVEIGVDRDPEQRRLMVEKSGRQTVPQIWIGDSHVGGFEELWALDREGKLTALVEDETQ